MDMKARSICYYTNNISIDASNRLSMLYRMISENSSVLDVGCANGGMGKVLFREKKCLVWGMDYNPYSIQNARATGAYQEIYQTDLNQFDPQLFSHLESQFDFIIFGDVLEHLLDPTDVLEKFKRFLKPDGSFLISLPNIAHGSIKMGLLQDEFNYTSIGILDCTHLRFFTYKTFPSFFGNLGLKIQEATGTVAAFDLNRLFSFPMGCRRMILKDIHSWVFQYVMKVRISAESPSDLEAINRKKLDFTKDSLPANIYLYNDRSHYYLNVYFPFLVTFLQKWFGPRKVEKECH